MPIIDRKKWFEFNIIVPMIIKEEIRTKKNLNFFFKFYFIQLFYFWFIFNFILILGVIKNNILSRLHVSSVINYLYIIHKIMSVTYNVEEFNLNISFENIVDLENQRINDQNDKEINNNN